MMLNLQSKAIIQEICLPESVDFKISVLREDLVHPFTGGNKWRKLKYNLIDFKEQNKNVLLTFGGAYSNHLIATASAAYQLGITSIGIIRGDEVSNPCIQFMLEKNMKLIFISREEYRLKDQPQFISDLLKKLISMEFIRNVEEVFVLPEGGSNFSAVEGTKEIASEIPDADNIFCACGTGATLAGISIGAKASQQIHGVAVLKGASFLEKNISDLGGDLSKIIMHYDYHFGGYGKSTKELDEFCMDFYFLNKFRIEPVYTGKLFFAINDLLKKGTFQAKSSITAIHTGGIFPFYP